MRIFKMGDAPHRKRAIRFVWRLLRKTMHFARNQPFSKDYQGIANLPPDKFNLTNPTLHVPPPSTLPPPTPPTCSHVTQITNQAPL